MDAAGGAGGDPAAFEPAYAVANDLPPPPTADAPAPGDGYPQGYGGGRGRGRGRGRGGGDGWPRSGHRGGRGGGGRDPWRPRPPPGQFFGPPGDGVGFGLPPPPGAVDPYASLPVAFGRAPRGPPQAKRPRHGEERRGRGGGVRGGGGRGGVAAGVGALAQGHIGQFVKPSFLDNPWAELERQLGLPSAMQSLRKSRTGEVPEAADEAAEDVAPSDAEADGAESHTGADASEAPAEDAGVDATPSDMPVDS